MTVRKVLADALAEPKPTVREAMRFGAFAKVKLVAGAEGLDRAVEWVRSMETPEVQPRAGDLMFTTGFPIKDDRAAQIRLVERIADSEGAGLVVRPHPYLRQLPAEMITEADRLNVPLFTVGPDSSGPSTSTAASPSSSWTARGSRKSARRSPSCSKAPS